MSDSLIVRSPAGPCYRILDRRAPTLDFARAEFALAVGDPAFWIASASNSAISAAAAIRRATVPSRPLNQCGECGLAVTSSGARPCAISDRSSPDFSASNSQSDSLNWRMATVGLRRNLESIELSVIRAVTAELSRSFMFASILFASEYLLQAPAAESGISTRRLPYGTRPVPGCRHRIRVALLRQSTPMKSCPSETYRPP